MGLCIALKPCRDVTPLLSNITFRMGDKLFDLMPEAYVINGGDL